MATWVSSVIVPVGVSIATVVVTNLTVGPRLAARGKRIQAAHDARDRFSDSILDLLALCSNLQTVIIPETIEEPDRPRLQAERDRWEARIGEITAWLADHWQRYALGYIGTAGIRDLITRYAASARGVWISPRPLEDRVRILKDLTEPMHTILVGSRWRAVAIPREADRLRSALDNFDSHAPADPR